MSAATFAVPRWTRGTVVATVIALVAVVSMPRALAGGGLDYAFGRGGKASTYFGPTSTDVVSGMALQPDGKIVLAGWSDAGDPPAVALARFNSNGTLDTSFGTAGRVLSDQGAHYDFGNAVALQASGEIVVAGSSLNGADTDIFVARYGSTGTRIGVTKFGLGQHHQDQGNAVAVQTDGKIVVAGATAVGSANSNMVVARLNPDGTMDATFGTNGVVTTDLSGGHADAGEAVAIQSDGKIVVGGTAGIGGSDDFALVRYLASGALDTSFDGDGIKTTDWSHDADVVHAIAIQGTDGKIVAAGQATIGGDTDFAVARYLPGGALDTSFHGTGKHSSDWRGGNDAAEAVAIQSDGRVVAAGASFVGGDLDFRVIRYTINGYLDPTFPHVNTWFGEQDDVATGVAIQPDGKVVAAGTAWIGGDDDFAVARWFG